MAGCNIERLTVIPAASYQLKTGWRICLDIGQFLKTMHLSRVYSILRVEAEAAKMYVSNRLSAQSTRTQLYVGNWSLAGYVPNTDVLAASRPPDVEGDQDIEIPEDWDKILL